ncbi:MAG: BatD family protein [Spirochaetaceae bacterium]|nr:BatD family protein [Spirochaetaceae bacterium]
MAAFLARAEEPAVEEPKEKLKILFEFAPDAVVYGEPFTLNIVVNRTNPDEISVVPPDFHDAFRIERLRTEARIVRNAARGGDRWTVFEFTLTAVEPGLHELGAFEVNAPDETMLTNPINVDAREAKSDLRAALAWFGQDGLSKAPYTAAVGAPGEVALRITNWPQDKLYPAGELPMRIEPPQNAILEYIPLTEKERAAGTVLRLRITALGGQSVKIDGQSVRYENLDIYIPPLTLAVPFPAMPGPAKKEEAGTALPEEGESPAAVATQVAATEVKPVLFSGAIGQAGKFFFIFRTGAENCLKRAESLWEREMYAEALAVLRSGERSLSAARVVKETRKRCEDALGLPVCPDETRLPVAPLSVVSALFLLAAVLLFIARKRSHVPAFCAAAAFAVSLSALSLLAFSYFDGLSRAVLKHCAAYPIPEENVQTDAFFREGEPARIRSSSDSWLYADSSVKSVLEKSGWIKKENAVTAAGL